MAVLRQAAARRDRPDHGSTTSTVCTPGSGSSGSPRRSSGSTRSRRGLPSWSRRPASRSTGAPCWCSTGEPRGRAGTARVIDPDRRGLGGPAHVTGRHLGRLRQPGNGHGRRRLVERDQALDDAVRRPRRGLAGDACEPASSLRPPSSTRRPGGRRRSAAAASCRSGSRRDRRRRRAPGLPAPWPGRSAHLRVGAGTPARGVTTVFCSAHSDDVARVYGGVGFTRVATACISELPS